MNSSLMPADALVPAAPRGENVDQEIAHYRPLNLRQLGRLWEWMRPYRRAYVVGLVCGLLIAGAELVVPRIARRVIDVGIPSAQWQVIAEWGLIWAAITLTSMVIEAVQIRFTQRAGEQVVTDLRRALFAHLQRLSMSYFDRTKLGQILTRPTNDLDAIRATVVGGLNVLVLNFVLMIGAAVMILLTDWVLFLSIVWLIPLLMWLNGAYRRKAGAQHQVVRAGFARIAANLAENLTGAHEVMSFNRQAINLRAFNLLQRENTINNLKVAHQNGVYQPLLEGIRLAGQLILLGYGGVQVFAGRLTPGEVVAAFLYWDLFMRPTITLGTFYNTLLATMASSERVFDLLDTPVEVQDVPDAKPLEAMEGHVQFEHVTFGYERDRPVLKEIDLDIPAGSTVALVGTTGSGKSTILSLLVRFYEPQSGVIRLDGRDIQEFTLESLRRQFGVVLQANYLFSGSILDNIRYGRPTASDEEVYEAARQLGVHDEFASLPNGYQTNVGERGSAMSLGQRQMICFARVFLADPWIFLLDEATSSVDRATEHRVHAALERLAEGRTTIIVAHRLSTITHADKIVLIDRGQIAESGTHDQLLAARGKYARLYEKFLAAQTEASKS